MRLVVLLLFTFVFSGIIAQELPPVQNFFPQDYQAENQNWAIGQAEDKSIFVANNKGLLRFNGASWTFYPSPNESIVRSIRIVGQRIYIGCYMEFGYWEKDDAGLYSYTSLSDAISDILLPDEEFWTILEIDNFMIFRSRNRIYIYNISEQTVKYISSETEIPGVFALGQNVYFQKIQSGLYKIEKGEEVLMFNDEVLLNDEVVNIFESNGALLILTSHNGFYKANPDGLEKWFTVSEQFLEGKSIYTATQLRNRHYALGTISDGLIILGEDGLPQNSINELQGLQNNTVLAVFEDKDQNLWLGLDNGISYVNLQSPFRVFRDNTGQVGSVYTSAIKDGILYLGSNQGLFYKYLGDSSDFRLIGGTQGQVWSLNIIGDKLFAGHHRGTYIVEQERAVKIADIPGTWKLERIGNSELLLQGNYSGLYVLVAENNTWKIRNKISGFDHSARFFEIFQNTIFVNHEYKGIFKIHVDADFQNVNSTATDASMIGANSGIARYKNNLYYAYQQGVYRYDWAKEVFIPDSILNSVFKEDKYVSGKLLVDNRDQFLWIHTQSKIYYASTGNLSDIPVIKSIPLPNSVRNSIAGYESVMALPRQDHYLFGNSSGFITASLADRPDKSFRIQIADIRQAGKNISANKERKLNPEIEGILKNGENNLEISYNTAEYNMLLKPQYQYQLMGIYPQWSDWTDEHTVLFENLPHGDFDFRVRARIGNTISDNIAVYKFSIARPWYLSRLSLVLYAIAFVLLVIVIHNSYKLKHNKSQAKLIAANRRQLELVKLQNEREIINLKNIQLKKDFRDKSNELAASTMSILKKNQLLVQVKEQLLSSTKNEESVKPLIRIIDRNLKRNDDWELFKEAFNNADRKFLKKLEAAHPNLTPNDIRLCAYLRLNLSSKEMAELFNISARSVEIKRYRLRKKMGLARDENLVNYILKL